MKKILILLSLVTIAFGAIGCGDSSEPGSNDKPVGEINPTDPANEASKPAVGGVGAAPTPTMPPK